MSARTAEPMTAWRDFSFKGRFTYQYAYIPMNAQMILIYLIRQLKKESGMNEIRR